MRKVDEEAEQSPAKCKKIDKIALFLLQMLCISSSNADKEK
jgi:hypothetical protein